jgi:hypothetical protein
VTSVSDYQPTFQWHADPGWELADQMHFSDELRAGQIVADDIDTHFQCSWPQMWQEAAERSGRTPEEMREAVRAYGRWLTAVADHDTAESAPERDAGDDHEPSDVDDTGAGADERHDAAAAEAAQDDADGM